MIGPLFTAAASLSGFMKGFETIAAPVRSIGEGCKPHDPAP